MGVCKGMIESVCMVFIEQAYRLVDYVCSVIKSVS